MLPIFRYLFFVFTCFFFTNAISLESAWNMGEESQVRIISPSTHNNNQKEIFLGLEYHLQDGWKTYWQSPGDGGFPQEINWNRSKNIKSLEIQWPVPKKFEILGLQSIGYQDNIIFPLKIDIINPLESTDVILDINYLVCKDICIPGKAILDLILPAGEGNLTKHLFNLEKSLSKLPLISLDLSFIKKTETNIFLDDKKIHFKLSSSAKKKFKNPKVFLHTKYGLPVTNPKIQLSANSKKLDIAFIFDKDLIRDSIVQAEFVIVDQNQSLVVREAITIENNKFISNNNTLLILLFAFIGGFILNGMPCVLPILSIKVLSMLQHLDNKSSIRKSFFVTSLGIVTSFIMLAISFMLLRYLGVSVGWGMQFQQPIFLMIIALILSFFAFNLLGYFELPIPNFMNNQFVSGLHTHYYLRDFFNGFFATVMATPCSAPFVGTAIAVAFTQSFAIMLLVFIFMSLGMSSPYLLVSLFPNLLNFFPKPGKWMIYLKYILGILLLATLIWIGNILLNHFNYYFIICSVCLLIITLIIMRFIRIKKVVLSIAIIIFFTLPNFIFFKSNILLVESDWLDFNSVNIETLIEEGNIVFVDITADWCATCQYNKINVLNSKIIEKTFDQFDVIKIKGDWTKSNDNIQKFLEKNKKYGIPFNVIYNSNNPNGIVLSELLSESEIVKILNNL
jgi:suppressor for copper-sensitivity B